MPISVPGAPIVTRFAPSPTGPLHLGSAFAAHTAWHRARDAAGQFLLRIEDIDSTRCRAEYTASIIEDLRWLGLDWDGPIRRQSEHRAEYQKALDRLAAMDLLYPCTCTRADIAAAASAPHGPEAGPEAGTQAASIGPIYPGTCRHRSPSHIDPARPYAIRLNVAKALRRTGPLTWFEVSEGRLPCDPAALGDPVLARNDAPTSYHLCVTHDDAHQGVTLVTRGADLRPATSLHRLLQALLGWAEPAYAHHPVLTGLDGKRLAKRDGAASIGSLRASGLDAAAVLARLA